MNADDYTFVGEGECQICSDTEDIFRDDDGNFLCLECLAEELDE
jgi:hypothetical protein